MLLFGWLMGLVSATIIDIVRRHFRRRDLMRAVVDELAGFQYTMAVVAWHHRVRSAAVTDRFLDRIIPMLESYTGSDQELALVERMRDSRPVPEAERTKMDRLMKRPNMGLGLKQYLLPLLVTQLVDLVICPLPFQRDVLRIRYHLDLFNQAVPLLQTMFDRTFANLSAENHEAAVGNLEDGYRKLGERAEIVVEAIERLKRQYGT